MSLFFSHFVDEPRTTKEGITDYFVNFLKNKPQGVITDGITLSGPVRPCCITLRRSVRLLFSFVHFPFFALTFLECSLPYYRIGPKTQESTSSQWVSMDPRCWPDTVLCMSKRMDRGRLRIIIVVPCQKVSWRQRPRLSNWRNFSHDLRTGRSQKYMGQIRIRSKILNVLLGSHAISIPLSNNLKISFRPKMMITWINLEIIFWNGLYFLLLPCRAVKCIGLMGQ
jgi:hypothetical protein